KLARITAETGDPPGGVIYRKPGTKEPTGLLRDNAMNLLADVLPGVSAAEIAEAVHAALKEVRQNGLTSVQDLAGGGGKLNRQLLRLYQQLAKGGQLTVR